MKRHLLFVLIFALYYLTGCYENSMNFSKTIPFKQIVYTTNPCEQEGIDHNLLLDSIISYFQEDYDLSTIEKSFIEASNFDTILVNYVKRAHIETGIDPMRTFEECWNEYDTNWISIFESGSNTVSHFHTNYNYTTPTDSIFCSRILNMLESVFDYCYSNISIMTLDSLYDFVLDSSFVIENEMLSDTSWNVNSDNIAWKRIAILKKTVVFWKNYDLSFSLSSIKKRETYF